jgi:deoxyribonuclease IV
MSIAGGPGKAFRRGQSVGCETMQIFMRSPNRWQSPPLSEEQVEEYRYERERSAIWPVVAHSSYLINLGSPEEALWERSIAALIDELTRCQRLGIDTYVLHPGSHRGAGEEQGLERVARGVGRALEAVHGDHVLGTTPAAHPSADRQITIAFETTAGQGYSLGGSFEHLAWLVDRVEQDCRAWAAGDAIAGVCLDTAHILATGIEFRQPESYAAMWRTFDRVIGIERLRVLHLNDSKRDLGAKVDRHEHIGEGFIGLEAFRLLVNDPALRHVPMILETPKEDDRCADGVEPDAENLARLRQLIEAPPDRPAQPA